MLTASACSASGSCAAQAPTACANHLACANATTCNASCGGNADCVTGYVCSGGSCVTPIANGGACSGDGACISNICGINGTGNCCAAACNIADATCGATACDSTGTCVYPAALMPCGVVCTGSALIASACDGLGTCVADAGIPCSNGFACANAGSCAAACTDNTTCAPNNFCDTATGTACCAIASGTGLTIDNSTGNDGASCCGIGDAGACQTLTRGMQLVGLTNALKAGTFVTLNASINGDGGGDWTAEVYPVSLGWGVTLNAPGVYFNDVNSNAEIFDVALQTGEVAENPVVIGGASALAADRVVIGVDSSGDLTFDSVSVHVESGQTLDILNAQVLEKKHGNLLCANWCGIAIDVEKTATLNISSDNSGNAGTLYLGGLLPNGRAPIYGGGMLGGSGPSLGILCNGTITDGPTGATPSLVSQRKAVSIDAEDSCSVTLANDPTFGPPSAGGFSGDGGGCAAVPYLDGTGIMANGNAVTVTLSGATLSCMADDGIEVTNAGNGLKPAVVTIQADTAGNPSVIENCEVDGIYATAGSTYIIGSIIRNNLIGIDMETDTSAGTNPAGVWVNDGTGNAQATNSSVICNSSEEIGGGGYGFDIYNNSTAALNADYVNWDQWYDPNGGATGTTTDIFYCDDNFTCTCEVFNSADMAVCVNTTNDDMDLVMGTGMGTTPTGTYSANSGASSGSGCQ